MNVVIAVIAEKVKKRFEGEGSGHDWWHVYRVWKMAQQLGREEEADMFVVELAALLHDIADHKFHNGDDTVGPRIARQVLMDHKLPDDVVDHVCEIIATLSYRGAGVTTDMQTVEGRVVQDADRLDAIGAVGIARCFAYGGEKKPTVQEPRSAFGLPS